MGSHRHRNLGSPRDHQSMGSPLEPDSRQRPPAPGLHPRDQAELLAAFARAYGTVPTAAIPVPSLYYQPAALRLNCPSGAVALKPCRCSRRALLRLGVYLRRLRAAGPGPWVQVLFPRDGRPFLEHRGRFFLVTRWEEGRGCRARTAEVQAAAAALAAFHQAGRGMAPWRPERSWPRRWEPRLKTIAQAAAAPGAPVRSLRRVLNHARRVLRVLAHSETYSALEARARAEAQLCHRDLTPANVVITPRGEAVLLDPDTWGPDLRLADLVALAGPLSGLEPETAVAALQAYNEAGGELTTAEIRLLPWALELPWEVWWACRHPTGFLPPGEREQPTTLERALATWQRRQAVARAVEEAWGGRSAPT